eukprot:5986711-Lingulodinium_polyedra.AAC.1
MAPLPRGATMKAVFSSPATDWSPARAHSADTVEASNGRAFSSSSQVGGGGHVGDVVGVRG